MTSVLAIFFFFLDYVSLGKGDKSKNKQMEQHPTEKLLHSDEINLYFKAGQRKIKHKILCVCACGPLPSLPNIHCASMLHINQTSSEMGVPAQA